MTSLSEQIARDMREGTFPQKSEATKAEDEIARLKQVVQHETDCAEAAKSRIIELERTLRAIVKLTNECSDPKGWLAENVRQAAQSVVSCG